MKHLLFFLLLVIISCKSEPKSDFKVDASVYELWNDFTTSNPEFKNEEIPDTEFFHNNEKDANRLAKLTVEGKKQASSGLYLLYKHYQVELPKVGKKLIITNYGGKAKAIIETVKVDTIPFNKISKEYASMDMGATYEPLIKWKEAHWTFFTSAMKEIDEKPTEDMLVVCERFKTIWAAEN